MFSRASFLLLLPLIVGLPAIGLAQLRSDPRETASMRVGPVYMTPAIQLRNLGIETNVFNQLDDPKSDFTYTFAPMLQLWLPVTRRFLLSTRSEVGVSYFRKYADQRSIDPRFLVRGDILLRRLTVFVENDFLWAKQRADTEIDDRVRRRNNITRAGVIVDLTPKFSTEVSLYQGSYGFDSNFDSVGSISYRAALSRKERGLRVGLTHRLTSRTTLVLEGETQRTRFDFAQVKDADGYRISPGVIFAPRALIGGTAKVGIRRLMPLHPVVPGFNGVVADVKLGYTVPGAGRLTLEASRDLQFSPEVSQPYYVVTALGGNLRRHVWRDFDVVVGSRRTRQDHRALAGAAARPRRDLILFYSADVGYHLNRAARVGFLVSWQRRESSAGALRNYRGMTAGLSFTYGS